MLEKYHKGEIAKGWMVMITLENQEKKEKSRRKQEKMNGMRGAGKNELTFYVNRTQCITVAIKLITLNNTETQVWQML